MVTFDLESDVRTDIREIKQCLKAQGVAIAKLETKIDLVPKIVAAALLILSVLFPSVIWAFTQWR